jgi:hypothetical protein
MGKVHSGARLGEWIDLPSIDASFCAPYPSDGRQVGSAICSIIYLNELMTSKRPVVTGLALIIFSQRANI